MKKTGLIIVVIGLLVTIFAGVHFLTREKNTRLGII